MKFLCLSAATLLLLTACSSPSNGSRSETGGAVATIVAQEPRPGQSPADKEIACRIQMIDGVMIGASDRLKPGHHRLIVSLGRNEGEYAGDVDLIIPRARNYRLKAERSDELFTLSLVEIETGRVVASSTAEAGQIMKFEVFVLEK